MNHRLIYVDGRNDLQSIMLFTSFVTGADTISAENMTHKDGSLIITVNEQELEFKKCSTCPDIVVQAFEMKVCPECGWYHEGGIG